MTAIASNTGSEAFTVGRPGILCVYNGAVKKFAVKTAGKRERLWGIIIAGVELPELGQCQVLQYGGVGHGSWKARAMRGGSLA